MAFVRMHVARIPYIADTLNALGARALFSSEALDSLVWPPPEIPDNVALQKLLGAQKLLQENQKVERSQENSSSASGSARKQGRPMKQSAPQRADSKPAGRVAELVKGLLATRNIEMASMDKDTLEKLRVVDLRQLLAALSLPQRGLKSSLVDIVWQAASHERASGWTTELPRSQSKQERAEMQAAHPAPEAEAPQSQMPYSHVVTGSEVAEMLKDAKTDDVTVLDVRPRQCDFTDEIVIATARSKLHCQTAAQAVVYRLKQACKEIAPGIPPRIEGMGTSHHANSEWLVVDCGSVIAHIFQGEEARMQYNLEKLWADPASREPERQADSSYAL